MTDSDIVEAYANAGAVLGNLVLHYRGDNISFEFRQAGDYVTYLMSVYGEETMNVYYIVTLLELLSADPVLVSERLVCYFDNELKGC